MSIEVTVRHMDARDVVQEYARSKAELLCRDFPRIEHIHVILDTEKHNHVAEVVVQARNHIRLEAKESTDNLRSSIDVAVEKIEKQMRRLRDKVQDHKPAMRHGEEVKTRATEVES